MAARMSKVFRSKTKELGNLTGSIDAQSFTNSHLVAHYGLAGTVLGVSYEHVQSLLAIATNKGIYVLGQDGVEVFYKIAAGHQVVHLTLHKSHLLAIDDKQMLYTWDLETSLNVPVVTQALRGVVTCTYAEYSLDWLFLGMKDGTILAWDLLAEQLSPSFKVRNQYFDRQEDWRLMGERYAVPRYHISSVLQLAIHPTDLGMLLITYADGACLFSIKENTTKTFYECIIPAMGTGTELKPALTCSGFSPDGQFVVIACVDGTFAFFDVKEGDTPLQVRNLEEANINRVQHTSASDRPEIFDPIMDLQWCCRQDPTDTYLIIAGGLSNNLKGISVLDYGRPPARAADMSEYFAMPQRQKILPISRATVLSMTALGTASPYHVAHDPHCLSVVDSAGQLHVLNLPGGQTSNVLRLPSALSLSFPHRTTFASGALSRTLLSAMTSQQKHITLQFPALLVGGASRLKKTTMIRNGAVLCTVHKGCLLRIYDRIHGSISAPPLLELDLGLTMPNT